MRLSPAAGPLMFHRSHPALVGLAMERIRPMRSTVPDAAIDDPAWMSVPSSYVVCGDDRAVRPDAQRERAALVGGSAELDADHSPFFSRRERAGGVHRGAAPSDAELSAGDSAPNAVGRESWRIDTGVGVREPPSEKGIVLQRTDPALAEAAPERDLHLAAPDV